MSPSSACSQLHSRCRRTRSRRRGSGPWPRCSAAAAGRHGRPCRPRRGRCARPAGRPWLHLVLEVLLRRHVGHVDAAAVDVELPAVVDAADAASSLRPRNSDAQRCGQRWSITPTRPGLSRKATSFSPSSIRRTGSPSASTSDDSHRRQPVLAHQLPITVPGPTRVRSALSCACIEGSCHEVGGTSYACAPSRSRAVRSQLLGSKAADPCLVLMAHRWWPTQCRERLRRCVDGVSSAASTIGRPLRPMRHRPRT
jgi:hypothetical protein